MKEHQHRDLSTSLRFGRDDKGEGSATMKRKEVRNEKAERMLFFATALTQVAALPFVQQLLFMKPLPSPLSSRPKRSEVERSLC
jgi:hypothetical protein